MVVADMVVTDGNRITLVEAKNWEVWTYRKQQMWQDLVESLVAWKAQRKRLPPPLAARVPKRGRPEIGVKDSEVRLAIRTLRKSGDRVTRKALAAYCFCSLATMKRKCRKMGLVGRL